MKHTHTTSAKFLIPLPLLKPPPPDGAKEYMAKSKKDKTKFPTNPPLFLPIGISRGKEQ